MRSIYNTSRVELPKWLYPWSILCFPSALWVFKVVGTRGIQQFLYQHFCIHDFCRPHQQWQARGRLLGIKAAVHGVYGTLKRIEDQAMDVVAYPWWQIYGNLRYCLLGEQHLPRRAPVLRFKTEKRVQLSKYTPRWRPPFTPRISWKSVNNCVNSLALARDPG